MHSAPRFLALAVLAAFSTDCSASRPDATSNAVESNVSPFAARGDRFAHVARSFTADLARDGVHLNAKSASFSLRTKSFGRKSALHAVAEAAPIGEAKGLRYERDGLVEWWRPASDGLEQGFEIASRPQGDGALVVSLAVEGGLVAERLGDQVVLRDGAYAARAVIRGLHAFDASGRALGARFEVAGAEVSIVVDDANAKYPITIDPVVGTESELRPASVINGSQFGSGVSIVGDRLLVGASGMNVAATSTGGSGDMGAAFVFDRDASGAWNQTTELIPSNGANGDEFGGYVLLGTDLAIVAAPSKPSGTLTSVGAVYVYSRSAAGTWSQAQIITPPTPYDGMSFGSALAINGKSLFIAASDEPSGALSSVGAVYEYTQGTTGTFTFGTRIATKTPSDGDRFGRSITVSVNGTSLVLAVGAPNHAPTSYAQGGVFMFSRPAAGGAWTELPILEPTDTAASDYFGYSISMDGPLLAIGASGKNTAISGGGAVYGFTRDATKGTWSQTARLTASDETSQAQLGTSVAVKGTTIAASAYNHDLSTALFSAGQVYLFTQSGSTWTQRAIAATDAAANDQFGNSISFDGSSLAVGASRKGLTASGEFAGQAYVFRPAAGNALGGACSRAADCASGFCVDGVCCDKVCNGQCEACSAAGACQALDGAAPHAPKAACTAPYKLCVKGACATSCTADADCASGASCDATHACVATTANGGACTKDAACASGHCVDGLCCDTACTDTCAACDVMGHQGTCTTVKGPTHGTRSCGGTATDPQCGLSCDGTDSKACHYATAAVACASASCTGAQFTSDGVCDGAGKCSVTSAACPNNLTCGDGGKCKDKCATDSDCIARSKCIDQKCAPPQVGTCSPDGKTSTDDKGAVNQCEPYLCNSIVGLCGTTCTSSVDCSAGNTCDLSTQHCIPSAGNAADGGSGGCSMGGASSSGGSFALALAVALGLMLRRRD